MDANSPPSSSFLHCLLVPLSHPFHIAWSFLICIIIIYFLVQTIFVSCFDESKLQIDTPLKPIHLSLCFLLLLDIPLNFFKSSNSHDNEFRVIAKKYLKGKFSIDVLSIILVFISVIVDEPFSVYLRLIIVLRIYDLFQLQKQIFKLLLNHHFLRQFSTILKIFLFELFVIHCASCLFFLIGRNLIKYEYYGSPIVNSELYWLTTSVVSSPIIELPLIEQYLWSFYFGAGVISTIVIGDIVGHNPIETSFILVMIFIGTISEAYLFEVIVEAWGASYDRIKDYLKNLHLTTNYLRNNDIPRSLQHEVQTYLEFRWLQQHHQNNEEQNRILSKLPKSIKSMIVLDQFNKGMNQIELFRMLKPTTILYSNIVQRMKQEYYFVDEMLVNGSIVEGKLILVAKGIVGQYFQYSPLADQIQNQYYSQKQNKIIRSQQFFTGTLQKRILKTKTRVTALTLQRQQFLTLISNNKQIRQKFDEINHSILFNNNYQKINQSCECCEQFDHNVIYCQECHIERKVKEETDENQRVYKSRNRMLRSRKGSSTLYFNNVDEFKSAEEIKLSGKKERAERYIEKAWDRYYEITKRIQNQSNYKEQEPINKETTDQQPYQNFEHFHLFQNYYPSFNLISYSN